MISETDGQLRVAGEMNQQTASALLAEAAAMFADADRVINLSGVTHVDSTALAVLLDWMRAARATGHQLRVVAAPASLVSLAALYGVDALIFPATQEAEDSVHH